MKVLAIFDIHGRSNYIPSDEQIDSVDKVIFGGDYFDSFDIHASTQIRVFQKVLRIKEKYEDKIIILLGNHDIQYLYPDKPLRCSGFSYEYQYQIGMLLKTNEKLFQYAWQHNNHLFTHAGVSTFITDAFNKKYPELYKSVLDNEISLADLINATQMDELFYIGGSGGDHPKSGIFWIRPKYLDQWKIKGYIQHVGHTYVGNIWEGYLESDHVNYYDGLGIVEVELN